MSDILNEEEMLAALKIPLKSRHLVYVKYELAAGLAICPAQAEKSKKALIEWLYSHSVGITADNELKDNPLWQAFLKGGS